MKLDLSVFRYLSKEEFRVLVAVEMGMRNHEFVPAQLVESIARISRGGCYKLLQTLLRNSLVAHDGKKYDGYRLTYHGFDFLAIRALAMRGSLIAVGRRLGVGKESDVHYAQGPNGEMYALKLHRLGRVSFRAIKAKRDYLRGREHASWMYMARLAAIKEFAYMKALADEGFPVPTPIDQNRHAVVMTYIQAVPLYHARALNRPHHVLERLMRLLVRLARAGVVHGDFNEFNLMIDADMKVTLIDFPQIVHMGHANAEEFFDRDVRGVTEFFRKRLHIEVETWPTWQEATAGAQEAEATAASAGSAAAVLRGGNVAGLAAEDDALLVGAHEKGRVEGEVRGDDDSSDESGEEEEGEEKEEGKEKAEAAARQDCPAAEGIASAAATADMGLQTVLGGDNEAGDEEPLGDLAEGEAACAEKADTAAAADTAGAGDEEEEEEESDDNSSEAEAEPGQLPVAGKRVRKKHTAKDARKNLQKQHKKPPAKPNNLKSKDLRRAKTEIKEHFW